MNIETRLKNLEQRIGVKREFLLIIIGTMACDPEGPIGRRAVHHVPIGYRELMGERMWMLAAGESIPDLRDRIEAEMAAEGRPLFVVRELYDDAREAIADSSQVAA